MPNYYDELEIEDFAWDPVARLFHYPCPCGDRFEISKDQLRDGEEIAICPSCSLIVKVVYDYLDWEDYVTTDDEDSAESVDTPSTESDDVKGVEQTFEKEVAGRKSAQAQEGEVLFLEKGIRGLGIVEPNQDNPVVNTEVAISGPTSKAREL